MSSTWHEPVYHAAHGCQAASLSLTASRLRGLFWACQVESQKTAGFLAHQERLPCHQRHLSRSGRMLVLCVLKDGPLIATATHPDRKDDPDPHIGQGSHGYRMAFAFCSLALIILPGPWFTLRRLPGELMQGIAQRFDTAQATMRFGVHPALKEHRGGATQGLQTAGILIAPSVI